MDPVSLSPQGPSVSPIVAGVWKWGAWGHKLNDAELNTLVHSCVEMGVTTFDHADIYGDHTAEEDFGRILGQNPSLRDKIQLVTKCGIRMPSPNRSYDLKSYDTSYEHVTWSVDNSLRALRTDRIDLLLIHRPSPLMDPDEIARTVETLKSSGKVLHFGVSNFSPSQFTLLQSRCELATNQVEASLVHLAPFMDGTFDQLLAQRIRPMIWSPLGSGRLFSEKPSEQIKRILPVAESLVEKYALGSVDQVYLAWLMRHPSGPVPVLGTARIERLQRAVKACNMRMSREDWFKLWTASTGKEVP